jgi:uncharacterized protein (DUF1697 family)
METYISLLRGINVSGQKKTPMKELAAAYESLGFSNVRTYIQSGNVVFDHAQTVPEKLSRMIEEKIVEVFGFSASVIIRTKEELRSVFENNPFLKKSGIDRERLYVTFLSTAPPENIAKEIASIKDETDEFVVFGNDVYLYCPGGYGRIKLSNALFEKKTGVPATTRNWKTVAALMELA